VKEGAEDQAYSHRPASPWILSEIGSPGRCKDKYGHKKGRLNALFGVMPRV